MVYDGDDLAALPRDELEDRARALQTVLRVAEAASNARNLEELGARFAQAVATYTRFPSIAVWRLFSAQGEFRLVAQHGFDMSHYPSVLPARGSLTGLATERREILLSEDIADDPRLYPAMRAALLANEYRAAVSVPVVHAGEVLGALNLLYPLGTAPGRNERKLLGALAASFGTALAQRIAGERERELEEQARRAQQLESLGLLAGGIAHDFNNLLTGIVGNVELARLRVDKAHCGDIAQLLGQALGAAARATSLVGQLLTFSRGGAPARRATDELEAAIREVSSFAARGTSVRCEVEIAGPLGVVEVDVDQIGQVIQNLVLNACQASASGATVNVRARRETRDDSTWVVIDVIDTGRGIAPEHLPRIFEPFFSARRGGTGLGLAVSHSIVRRHGGRLSVRSQLGRGTTCTVELPALERDLPLEKSATREVLQFSGRALVMDDEETVRRVAEQLLVQLGFQVQTVSHGAEALDCARRASAAGKPFSVAILDVTVVGGLGAADIAEDLSRSSPGIRLIVSTGYAPEGVASIGHARLKKPYTLREVADALFVASGCHTT